MRESYYVTFKYVYFNYIFSYINFVSPWLRAISIFVSGLPFKYLHRQTVSNELCSDNGACLNNGADSLFNNCKKAKKLNLVPVALRVIYDMKVLRK